MKALPPLPPPPPLPLLLPPATTKAPAPADGKALFPPLLERERGGGKRRRGFKVSSTYSVYLYTTNRRGQRRRRIDGGGGSVISVTRTGGRNPLAVLLQPSLSSSSGEVVPAHTKQGVTSLTSVALGHGDKAVVVEEDFHPPSGLPKNLQSEIEVEARRMVLEGYSWSPPVSDTSLSHILDAKSYTFAFPFDFTLRASLTPRPRPGCGSSQRRKSPAWTLTGRSTGSSSWCTRCRSRIWTRGIATTW